ncbi:rifin [Plasmodium reichenowi]|uniref:Rifin n=1 Tax=Plasmodium reichenowi TaxID=5854 RepID=A0A060RR47_PLARE|nr:rifin [Plasmodium reichenowi]
MKVHYINILLFAFPLNILVNSHKKKPSTRLLCECDLYLPNYDSDQEMTDVMENFSKQTQQRFHEYDDRMKEKRKQCKEQCDKECQKIILKDKLEKELMDKFATLQTDIQSEAIPTCVCEKSLADKMEKECLKCTQNLGGIVAPSSGVLAGIAEGALYAWKPGALDAAIKAAIAKGADKILAVANAAGLKAGKELVIESLKELHVDYFWTEMSNTILEMSHYNEVANLTAVISNAKYEACKVASTDIYETMCEPFEKGFGITDELGNYTSLAKTAGTNEAIAKTLNEILAEAEGVAEAKVADVTAAETAIIKEAQEKAIDAASTQLYSAIGYSILAILIIILIMVIIYLILRYRRKKKMKKKLQYIKLLKE